tara:strand:+ start:344 stop:583 length:240 start_codon:yes stop_codon:yes gene_type:complete
MKFETITESMKVSPGEYVLHEPSQEIVMCGSFSREKNTITAIGIGPSLKDTIDNFRKIVLSREEFKESRTSRCKGCSGG